MRNTTRKLLACSAFVVPLVFPAMSSAGQPAAAPIILAQAQAQAQAQALVQPQAQPTPQQRAAMLKQWLQASEQQMRAYEWIETTVVSKDGEQKSSTQKRCYYGMDGKIQKVVLNQAADEKKMPGVLPLGRLVNRAVEKKKEEMTDYMKDAAELVHHYIPPLSGLIQQSINAGKMGMQMLEPGRRVRLTFGDYLKPSDSLGVDIELPTNRLLAVAVATYLDNPSDAIALDVTMSVLADGTIFAAHTNLTAKAKDLNVVVENSGHRRIAQ